MIIGQIKTSNFMNLLRNHNTREHLMKDMRAKINTEMGIEQYQKRMSTVEPVFGQIKQDRGFREFLLREKRKTGIEFVMMCTVHNIKKIADFIKKRREKSERYAENDSWGRK